MDLLDFIECKVLFKRRYEGDDRIALLRHEDGHCVVVSSGYNASSNRIENSDPFWMPSSDDMARALEDPNALARFHCPSWKARNQARLAMLKALKNETER